MGKLIFIRLALGCALLALGPGMARGEATHFLPQDLTARVWTEEQGLPNNSVTAVLQAQDGYLWVGTSAGLARFDGARFVPIAPALLRSNETICVTALCEDAARRLWVGTQNHGLLYYADGALRRESRMAGETINGIAGDPQGNLWLGTPTGLCRLNPELGVIRFTTQDGLPNDFISSVNVARSGTLWITTRGGLCQFKDGHIVPFPFQTDNPGRSPEPLGVYEDRRGNLWAFGDTYLVNLTSGNHLNHFSSGAATAAMRIWSLCEGRQGELWISTSGKGLYCFADNQFLPVTLRNGELTSDVRALCEDREGNLWLGTRDNGLIRLQPQNILWLGGGVGLPPGGAVACLGLNNQNRAWIGFVPGGLYAGNPDRFEPVNGPAAVDWQNLISSLAALPDGALWLGTLGQGLYFMDGRRTVRFDTANGLSDNMILAVAADAAGTVWAGTFSGGVDCLADGHVTRHGPESGLSGLPVTAILPARNGEVWTGDDGGGMARWSNGVVVMNVDPPARGRQGIRALAEDGTGRIWAGMTGGRVGCLIGRRFVKWDLNLGPAADNAIDGILTDDEGNLWLATARALYRVARADVAAALFVSERPAGLKPQLVFEAETAPLAAALYGGPRAVKAAAGWLWFGLTGGVVILDPRQFVYDPAPLPVVMEDIAVNGRELPPAEWAKPSADNSAPAPVRLPSDLRSLAFQFTALNFSAPEKIRFRHRLEGFDPDWIDGTERHVDYGRLPYGRYTFQVQAGHGDTWLSAAPAFHFTIPTPLWRTRGALTFYFLAAALAVAGGARLFFHRRLRRRLEALAAREAMERERMRIAKDMHDEIGSKLTKISFMSERAKRELTAPGTVGAKLDAIAHTSRDLLQSLDEMVWAVNPHNDTLEQLAAYLGQYATEYLQNTAVECELHLPQKLPHHPLSAETRHNIFLAFEEALNNALKHGRPQRIRVDMKVERAQFEIRVADNGCGFDPDAAASRHPARGGNGLKHLHQRLADAGGQCRIDSRPGQGTVVILTMPLRRPPESE